VVHGFFVENIPFIPVTIGWLQSVQNVNFILDTGFSGDLQVTPKMAVELGLTVKGATPVRIATGKIVNTPHSLALAAMEGSVSLVQVLISGGLPLAGINFLTKFDYKATLDCKLRTVSLQR